MQLEINVNHPLSTFWNAISITTFSPNLHNSQLFLRYISITFYYWLLLFEYSNSCVNMHIIVGFSYFSFRFFLWSTVIKLSYMLILSLIYYRFFLNVILWKRVLFYWWLLLIAINIDNHETNDYITFILMKIIYLHLRFRHNFFFEPTDRLVSWWSPMTDLWSGSGWTTTRRVVVPCTKCSGSMTKDQRPIEFRPDLEAVVIEE